MDFSGYLDKNALADSIARLVKIPSVSLPGADGLPFGKGCADCLEEALSIAREMGFETVNFDGYMGWAEYGRGDEMVAVLAHLDVVPEGEGWTFPPYGAQIEGSRIYGRGTIDDKGPAAAALHALKAVKDSGAPMKRRVRVMFGLNEEKGSAGIKYYVDHGGELPAAGFTPDAFYPIINGEKGILTAVYQRPIPGTGNCIRSLQGGVASNIVPNQAEVVMNWHSSLPVVRQKNVKLEPVDGGFRLTAKGVAAHGSTPEKGVNANGLLMKAMAALPLDEDTHAAVTFLANKIGLETDGRSLGIARRDQVSGGLTVCFSPLTVVDGKLTVSLGIRYPVTDKAENFVPAMDETMASGGFERVVLRDAKPLYISPDTPFIQKLQRVYTECTGQEAKLHAIGGGTYAKAMPNIVAFGPVFPGEEAREHEADEFADLDNLTRSAQIMAAAICALAND